MGVKLQSKLTFLIVLILFSLTVKISATDYIYNGTWSPNEPNWGSLPSGDTISIEENFTITSNVNIWSGPTLTISSGKKLTFEGTTTIGCTLINNGTIQISNSGNLTIQTGNITSTGTFINYNSLTFSTNFTNDGTIINSQNAQLNISQITNNGTITNNGSLSVTSTATNTTSGIITNFGTIDFSNGITNSGSIDTTEGVVVGQAISGTGNVTGNSNRNYIFKGTTNSDWSTSTNWSESPNISGSDNKSSKISLQADVTSSSRLTFNNSGTGVITIQLNGHDLTVNEEIWFSSDGGILSADHESTVNIIGPGNVTVKGIDTCDAAHCHLNLSNGVIFTATDSISADLDNTHNFTITDTDGTCTFYAPASGVDVNYGLSKLIYSNIEPRPYGTPIIFSVEKDNSSPFSSPGLKLTFNKKEQYNALTNSSALAVSFKYSVSIFNNDSTTNEDWTFNGRTDLNGTITIPRDSKTTTAYVLANSTSCDVGDGIIITIRTPDDTMDLAEIRYIQGQMVWTGEANRQLTNLANWNDGNGNPTETSWQTIKEFVIPGGCVNYPVYNPSDNGVNAINIPKLIIKNNANLTIENNGILNLTKQIECEGTGYIKFTSGTLNIVQDGDDIKTWKADYPEYSTFDKITFDNSDGTKKTAIFQPESDVYVKTSITNNNGAIFDAQTNHITTYCTGSVTITGGSDASTTKFDTLDCSNAGGKTLTFAGNCSANTLNFTGTSSSSLLTVTGSGAQIEVSADQVGGRYLSISDSTIPTICDGTTYAYTIYDSSIALSTPGDYSTFTSKGWIEGDPSEFIWLGKSTNWNSKSNWSSGMAPIAGSTVKIPAGKSFYPILAADINLGTDSSLLVADSAKIDLGGKKLSCPSVTINGTLKVNGSEDLSAITFVSIAGIEYYGGTAISYNSAFPTSVSSLIVSGSGTQLTVDSSISASSLKIDTGATLVSGDNSTDAHIITISSLWTNNGTFTPNQSTVTFTDSVTISGTSASSSFYNLTASGLGGKTLTINQNISVSNDLTLSGTAVDDELVITGNGKKIGISKITDAKWIKVDTSSKAPAVTKTDFTADSDIYIKALFSLFIDNTVKPTGWNIPTLITWNGTTTAWETPSNWTPATTTFTNEDEVLIPAGCSNYPELTSDVTIKSLTMEDDTNTALKISSGTLTISDTAKLAGTISGNITLSSTTQAFTTDGDITLNNAVITGNIDVDSHKLTTTGSTTLKGDVTSTSGNKISVQGDLTVEGAVNQPLVFEGSGLQNFTNKYENNYDIEIKKDDSNGVAFDVDGSITLKINSLTITKNLDSVTPANGSTTFNCPAEITTLSTTADSGNIIFNDDAILKNDTTFSQNAHLVVANEKTLSAATKKITFAGTGLSTGGIISAASFENTGTLSENAATKYVGNFTNNGTFTVDNAVTVSGSFTNNTGKTSNINNSLSVNGNFVDNGTISFDTDSGTAGYITLAGVTSGTPQTFNASTSTSAYKIQNKNTLGLTFLNDLTISDYVEDSTATGTLTFGDATTDTFTISAATFTRTAGPTVIKGELSVSAGLTASNLTIEGGTLTSTATSEIELTGTKINTGATLNGGTGGLKLTSAVYNTTTPPALTTNGKVNISTGKIKSLSIASGNTSLSGALEIEDVTFAASSTLTANNNNITVTGTWNNTEGGTFVPGTGTAGETVTQTVTFTGAATSSAASTVKGTTTFNDVTFNAQVNIENANSFNNLTFTAGSSGTIATALTVNGLTTINNSTNSLSFTNASNIFAGGVKFGDSATAAYAGDITLAGTGSSSVPIKIIADAYADSFTFESPVELLGNVHVTNTQNYKSTVAINSSSELTATSVTFADDITGATGTTFTVNAQTVIANDITISPNKIIFNNTINDDSAASETHTLTFAQNTEVTFNGTIGNDKTLNLKSQGNTIIQTNSINCTNQTYNTIDFQTSTTLSGGQINFNGNVSTTNADVDLSIKNSDSTWGQSGTPINVTKLNSINIINDGTTDIALNTENATIGDSSSSTPELIPFIFSGDSTGTNKKKINFNPGSSQFGNFEINDNAQLYFESDFTQYVPSVPRTDPISTNMVKFTINKGNVFVADKKFVVGYLIVKEGGKFEQKGNNDTPTAALQSVYRLENYAENGIVWDSDSEGGALTIIFGTTVNSNTKTIKYNKKNITLYANTIPLEGSFWDLIIPTDVTVTNDNYICVRRNFIIQNGGNYLHNNNPLVLGTDTITGLESATAGDPNFSALYVNENLETTTPINLGDVTINAPGITKTTNTNSNFLCTNLTITNNSTTGNSIFAPDSEFDIEITKNFTDNGTLNLAANKKIIFTGTEDSIITSTRPSTTPYPCIEINKSGKTTFESAISITNLENPISSNSTGDITFKGATTITNDVTFNTTGTITLNNISLTSANGSITIPKLAVDGTDSEIKAKQDITISNSITEIGTSKLTLDSPTNINLKTVSVNELILQDSSTANNTLLTIDGNITTNKTLEIPFNTDFASGATITVNGGIGSVLLPSDKTINLQNYPLTINAYTQLHGKIDGSGSDGTLTINNDAIINTSTSTSTPTELNAALTCQNLVVYNGKLKTSTNITTTKDFILLGANYNEKDQKSGIENIYSYKNPYNNRNTHLGFITSTHNENSPDGTLLPVIDQTLASYGQGKFSAELETDGAVEITVKGNFYANGITATGNSDWNLKLAANKNIPSKFNEAFYCDFTNSPCLVSCNNASATTDSAKIVVENTDGTATVKNQTATLNPSNPYETNWDLADFTITRAYTIHDNLIHIDFDRPIRTADGELSDTAKVGRITYKPSGSQDGKFKVILTNDNLENPKSLKSSDAPLSSINICSCTTSTAKSTGTWNTDANGIKTGQGYDTHKAKHDTIPYLDIPRNTSTYSYFITDEYGKRLIHYHNDNPDTSAKFSENGKTFTNIDDKTQPVIIFVKTGQEMHKVYDAATGESSQHSYDSHNYIEFIYSESVNIGSSDPAISDVFVPAYNGVEPNVQENVQVTNKLGALIGDITKEGKLTFAGIGSIEKGKIHTGKDGITDATVNAFYRDNPYSFKISIAGWTDGTITDRNGDDFKSWPGYIESAVLPSGKYELGSISPLIFDLNGNAQKEAPATESITVDSTDDNTTVNTYGKWDISSPTFAPYRKDQNTTWGNKDYSEAVGASSGSTLDRIEFHLFDNTPKYDSTDEGFWITQKGWAEAENSTKLKDYNENDPLSICYTCCADKIGGSRPFNTNAARRTSGGIRFSTTAQNVQAFKYIASNTEIPNKSFKGTIDSVYSITTSSFFTGSSTPRQAADDPDGLYFGLGLSETNLPVTSEFTISYDETKGFVTDLAGNRLRSDTIRTIDRTPPSIDLCLSPINQDELTLIFVKQLSNEIKLYDNSGNQIIIQESFEEILPFCFDIINIDQNGKANQSEELKIDTTVPAKISNYNHNSTDKDKTIFTFIKLKLSRNITLEDIKNLHVRLRYPKQYQEFSKDPITNIDNSRVTFIQDSVGNYTSMYTAHSLSDFAINVVTPLYAYDTEMTYQDSPTMNGLYEEGSWAVHDWEANQQNYGTLPAKHALAIVSTSDDGTVEQNNLPENIRIYLSNKPDANTVAQQFNEDFSKDLRVWLPEISNGLFSGFSTKNNSNYSQADSELLTDKLKDGLIFNLSADITSNWNNGEQITFLFGLLNSDKTPLRIYNAPYFNVTTNSYDFTKSTAVPVYALRLQDSEDVTSLDLWSFKVKSLSEQRGGVTILNNVIDGGKGEKAVVKVNMPSAGKLNVIVMTLDGNIVQYLNHGQTSAGEHYYSWNGKNRNGTTVARGMYFIRVVGNGIDETRKVIVTK